MIILKQELLQFIPGGERLHPADPGRAHPVPAGDGAEDRGGPARDQPGQEDDHPVGVGSDLLGE